VGGIINILIILLNIYQFILLVRVLMSWFRPDPYNPIVKLLYDLTEPVLRPIREALPRTGMMDFSPLVAFLLIFALQRLLYILL
jgi:YggT family protein